MILYNSGFRISWIGFVLGFRILNCFLGYHTLITLILFGDLLLKGTGVKYKFILSSP